MTARSLLLCCGAFVALGAASITPINAVAFAGSIAAEPTIEEAPRAFPGSVYEVSELVIGAGETLSLKGPVEFRVAGEVRIDGHIVVDGVESTGRPNLTIKSLGPVTVGKRSVLMTMPNGAGSDGGSIRLLSADTITLHGRLQPGPGTDGSEIGQSGGDAGNILIEAPVLRTSYFRIRALSGGSGGAGADGGRGGSVEVRAAVIWLGGPGDGNTTLRAGSGGHGGDGVGSDDERFRDGGNGGDGGQAVVSSYRAPEWLDEAGFRRFGTRQERRSIDAISGADGEGAADGKDGQTGVSAYGGAGGNGGQGYQATPLEPDADGLLRFQPPGRGGNGGAGGFAGAGEGGHGGQGGHTFRLSRDHADFGAAGGNGGDGGHGGSANGGHGGDAGLGGIYPIDPRIPESLQGTQGSDGHAGHAGQANGGHGGHGGHGGQGYGIAPRGGEAGRGGSATAGRRGMSADAVRRGELGKGEQGRAIPGQAGRPGNDGHSLGEEPPN